MNTLRLPVAGLLILMMAGCQTPETYPVSGEECTPEDPVQTLPADLCPPLGTTP